MYNNLHTLSSTEGVFAQGSLLNISGVLYGTTQQGGTNGNGTIFSINEDGSNFQVIYDFPAGVPAYPYGALVNVGSVLYGVNYVLGATNSGSVYSINTNGTGYTNLHSFGSGSDGANPQSGLLLISSALYGTCSHGGTHNNGTIFSIHTDGTNYSNLYNFNTGTDGKFPQCLLVTDGSNLYGICPEGGASSFGTIFSISTSGTGYSTLYSFAGGTDGGGPQGGLTLIGSILYGVCNNGGTNGNGTFFSITTSGTGYSTLYNFQSSDVGSFQAPLVQSAGILYGGGQQGAINGDGGLFSINTDGTGYNTLYSFTPDSATFVNLLNVPLTLDSSTVYGVVGNTNDNITSIFSFNLTASPTIFTPSTLDLTLSLYSPLLPISSTLSPSTLDLTLTLHNPTPLVNAQTVFPSTLDLSLTLHNPITVVSSLVELGNFNLNLTLNDPRTIPGRNTINNASKIISYNPLVIVSNTSPVKLSIVDVSTPSAPIYTTYTYTGTSNATDVVYNSDLNKIYVSCSDGIILEIDASSPTSYTINYTGASGNLTSLAILSDFFDVYAGTDYSTGEIVNMYEGSATTIACDVRFSASYQSILGAQINTINAEILSMDIRFVGIVNNIIGCDIRFISTNFSDLSITPIARTDFVVYIGGIEVPDVKLDSIEITHTADEKSQATFVLSRKHDNMNYVLNPDNTQGTYIPVLGHPTVQITIQGHEEFGYDTPAYIWDVDCKSENEQVRITAYSELPKQDERSNVTLSIPYLNEKLHVYHALVNNPVIDNPVILPDDINPPFYLGILIDNGYTKIQNVAQYQGLYLPIDEDQFVNYVFGSGDSGITDINGNSVYFKPMQNWTYFWFGHATNFITGDTWEGLLSNGESYLGTSPSSLTITTWDVDYINFWYQREFPDSLYRGTIDGQGLATVYPSDFLGIVPFPYNPDPYDKVVGIDPFNGATTIDEVLRDHTPMTFTGADILAIKAKLAVLNSPGSYIIVGHPLFSAYPITYLATAEGDLIPIPLNFSTKILDLIDSKFGVTFGSAPYKKVSCKSGVYTTATKWEDAPNGLFYHRAQGYNYTNYVDIVGEIELTKIQNINGSVLPKTKCDIEQFIDGYYYYNIQLLKRINIDQTTQSNIYNTNNGFPVSVKSIHISSKDMKVTLDCTNAWSRLELLEIEGQIPDSYYYLILEQIIEYSPKFDPNTLQNLS